MNKKKTYILWSLVLLCEAIIFFFSANTGAFSSSQSGFVTRVVRDVASVFVDTGSFDKIAMESLIRHIAHFTEYTVLGVLVFHALKNTRHIELRNIAVFYFPFCALSAVADELHQYFVPGRACEVSDFLIDALGFSLAFAVLFTCYFIKESRHKNHV